MNRRGMARGVGVLTVFAGLIALVPLSADLAAAGDPGHRVLTLRAFVSTLFRADKDEPPEFPRVDLSGYDLAGVDFKNSRLSEANFFGTDLTRAKLTGTVLDGANLNRAVIIRADFSGASMKNASLMRPTVFSDLSLNRAEAPKFRQANLKNARITGNLDGADFSGAILDGWDFEAHEPRADISFFPRNFCRGCKFTGASIRAANLRDASFVMADFRGADLAGSDLSKSDLSYADFEGANLTGANVADADFEGANLRGAKGLGEVSGLALAHNVDPTLR